MATDPVCGMKVDEKQAAAKAEYKGEAYYFCSTHCQKAFAADPRRSTRLAQIRAVPGTAHRTTASGSGAASGLQSRAVTSGLPATRRELRLRIGNSSAATASRR